MTEWVNNDGLLVRFGADQGARGDRGGSVRVAGTVKELVYHFTLTGAARTGFTADLDNDGTNDGFSGLDPYIPAGAKIVDIDWVVTETLAGGTNYEVGTYQVDGTIIDIDGILNENTGVEVGDDLNTTYANNSYVTFKTTGTYTAGKVKVIISYIEP